MRLIDGTYLDKWTARNAMSETVQEGRKEVYTRHGPLVNAGKSLATVVDTDYIANGLSNTLVNNLQPQPAGRIYATRLQFIN